MPALTLSNAQVIELVQHLPPDQQETLFRCLRPKQWRTWVDLSRYGEERVRTAAAQRARAGDAMTETERETFVDDLVHDK